MTLCMKNLRKGRCNMNIVLIGFMGSGKTTVAAELSKELNMTAVDTDVMIVERECSTINEIFATHGEKYFRDLETTTIKELEMAAENTIISVGGGLPVKEENQRYLKNIGMVVYLRAKVDTLEKRLLGDSTRPLLSGGDLRASIEGLMEKRADIYENVATDIIDTDKMSIAQVVDAIKNLYNEKNS